MITTYPSEATTFKASSLQGNRFEVMPVVYTSLQLEDEQAALRLFQTCQSRTIFADGRCILLLRDRMFLAQDDGLTGLMFAVSRNIAMP